MQDDSHNSLNAPFPITICGLAELPGHSVLEVSHVLSIVDPDLGSIDAFGDYGEHSRMELRFHDVIEDNLGFDAPQQAHVEEILSFGQDVLANPDAGRHLLVHCHMGVSRSTASMTLMLAQAQPDHSARQILHQVLSVREQAWPNLRILEFGERLLGRDGEFSGAVAEIYALQLDRKPELKQLFTGYGRGREIVAGEAFKAR
ncbi:MAG: protein-tyrosine-phosphatase [Hyphomicrobiales bacterium]|nr:protein-tyrosine-phosphatase [Hyphomicrobiales bacterium]